MIVILRVKGWDFFKLAANDCHKLKNILEEFEQAGKINVEYEDTLHELLSNAQLALKKLKTCRGLKLILKRI